LAERLLGDDGGDDSVSAIISVSDAVLGVEWLGQPVDDPCSGFGGVQQLALPKSDRYRWLFCPAPFGLLGCGAGVPLSEAQATSRRPAGRKSFDVRRES